MAGPFSARQVKGVFALSKQDTPQQKEQSPIERLSAFIVDERGAFYLVYIGVAIFFVFSSGWVSVNDDLLISILAIVFVILVLVFTFKSAGLPVLLILVIQGSVWINFSFPYLMSQNLFFLSYLVVSSIQMGANIDYTIVIANRHRFEKGNAFE